MPASPTKHNAMSSTAPQPSLSRRRHLQQLGAAGLVAWGLPSTGHAQAPRDQVTLNIAIEPDGLDPTRFASAACGQVVLYNILEGLVKITESGALQPLLAARWHISPDQRTYTFDLQPHVRFHDGEPLDAQCVLFSFAQAQAPDSRNKSKHSVFDNIAHTKALSPLRVELQLHHPDPHLLFRLAEAPAVILHPKSAAFATQHPIGTGPYAFVRWNKGHSVQLRKAQTFRDPDKVAIEHATFRFIHQFDEQALALERGEVDVFLNFITHDLHRFHSDPRYQVLLGASSGKGILAVNHRHPALRDLRVRRAITQAIDKQAFVTEILQGKGHVIGSHFAPTDPGYLNLSHHNAYNPEQARALLRQTGLNTPLELNMTLLPVPYAREGGPFVAAYLEKIGIRVNLQHVSWSEWHEQTFQGHFDLTLINHVEPLDHMIYNDPAYYFGYDSPGFRDLVRKYTESASPRERQLLYASIQRYLAEDAANVWIFSPQLSAVARKGLQGLWMNYPIFTHDIAALRWL